MKARGRWVVMLVMALLVVVPRVWGQQPPETHPVSTHQDVVMSWDRSAMPGDVELWAPRTVLGFSTDESLNYGQLFLTCLSNNDPIQGACPTIGQTDLSTLATTVRVQARERRSGMATEFAVLGSIERAIAGRQCRGNNWVIAQRPLNTARPEECAGYWSVGTGVSLSVLSKGLASLVAGHWDAALVLELRSEPNAPPIAVHTFNFELAITDHNAVSIYFPQYESASPLVNLDARFDPISQTVGGRIKMEMCLYDGLGSQAAYLGVTARDNGTRTPGPTGFSLWHPAAGTDDSQRLDYTVTIEHNGAPFSMVNGVEQQLTGIDSANLRLVVLPGMSQGVYCVPTPMTLEIPRVPVASKQSGTYWGDLVIELRVPTATP